MENASNSLNMKEMRQPKLQLKKLVLRDLSRPESLRLNRTNQDAYNSTSIKGDTVACGCCTLQY